MSNISPEIIHRLTDVQGQVWQTVSMAVSEASGIGINFGSAIVTSTRTADLYGELSTPMMVIQFALANQPDLAQVVLIPQETVLQILSMLADAPVREVDENSVAEMRTILEGIVQGICLAAGTLRNETVVASGLSLRFQIFTFPPNLQRAVELSRVQVAIKADDVSGSLMWLMDNETAHHVLSMRLVEDDHETYATPNSPAGAAPGVPTHSDVSGLEILLDVPLQLSVELGRKKMLVRDIVELTSGSIVEIDKAAGEPVDVMVNGRIVARGEVVVIEDNFGVRITEILNPNERLISRLGAAA